MASAGYDPRITPELWRKISSIYPYLSIGAHIYPSHEERAILLAQAHVMEQALTIYEEDIFKLKDEVYNLWLKVYKVGRDTSYGQTLIDAGIALSFQHGARHTVAQHAAESGDSLE
ncbi:hypothetical protein IFM89_028421 [Coptis chinensis]|uniref:Uncharacterized protein n=1 Tax=Coptis chinensis TaxID=261450 RepID=A0A835M6T1_9MAGN|nr:hypothetical protein IFM89_028421 [Coptis chinensis]